MSKSASKSRFYCYTIQNYTKKDLARFHKLASSLENHRYICYGLEVAPTTGTKHIQGYIELKEAQRMFFLHKYFNFTRNGKLLKFNHVQARGTAEQNKKYVMKDGDFYEYGEPSNQGKRTDMIEIKNLIKDNPRNLNQIIDEYCNNPQQLSYAQKLQPIYLPPRDPRNPPKVFWISGKSGIGKTSLVYLTFDDVCKVSSYKWLGTGYDQNECLLLDDFRPESLPFNQLLNITDRYPTKLEFKGGFVELNSPYIIITSPETIDRLYNLQDDDVYQLHRRVTEICLDTVNNIENIDLKNLDEKYIYKPVNDPNDVF